jgi:hypothetical protein
MQVRVCPKCGAENRQDRASCSNCYATLAEVELPESNVAHSAPKTTKASDATVQSEIRPRPITEPGLQPLAGVPLTGETPPPQPSGRTYSPPIGPSFARPTRESAAPRSMRPNWGAIILVIILIGGGAFAGWWFFLKPKDPAAVVQKMLNAAKAKDIEKAKECLSQSSLNMIKSIPGGEKMFLQGPGSSQDAEILGTTYEGDKAIVEIKPKEQRQNMPPELSTVDIVLVKEDKEWKVDFGETMGRLMSKAFKSGFKGGFRRR